MDNETINASELINCGYYFDHEKQSLACYYNKSRGFNMSYEKVVEYLGAGKITYKISFKKGKINKKTQEVEVPAHYEVKFFLESSTSNDYEIIPYSPDEATNNSTIAEFMQKYVTRPWSYRQNVVGTEINFNKVFYVPETLRPAAKILEDIKAVDIELKQLENQFAL